MKKFTLQGFAGYTFFNNKTATDPKGKQVKIAKDGTINLTATEDAEGIVNGQKYPFNIDDLMSAGADSMVEVGEAPGFDLSQGDVTEKTDAQKEKEAHNKMVTDLKGEVKKLSSTILEKVLGGQDSSAEAETLKKIKAQIDELTAKTVVEESPELKAARLVLESLGTEVENAKAALIASREKYNAQIEAVKALGGKVKASKGGGSTGVSHAAKLSYEDAQEIRRKFAAGAKVADLAKEYGVSSSVINYKIYYLQHKLRKGDVAHTPLVNKYYPALGAKGNYLGIDGAPYAEDVKDLQVKENRDKMYLVADNRD